ncbi:MAG: hypothetical protein KR126chlam1_01388 [Chlamydiae bacterium]|nr:hypothetical protein [Chlamydiota bacterium]
MRVLQERNWLRKVLVIGPTALLSITSSMQAHDYWCLNRVVSVFGEYNYLRRSEIRNLRLVEDTQGFDPLKEEEKGSELIDTKGLVGRMGWESGIRGGVSFHWSDCASLEAQYLYVYPWKGTKDVSRDGTLRFPFEDPEFAFDYIDADHVDASYKSRLQGGELNYWCHITPQRVNYFSGSWLIGFRYFNLREHFRMAFTKRGRTSDYKIRTKNHLYGAQLGGVLEMNPTECWTWLFQIKGAGFFNDADNNVFLGDFGNRIVLRDYSKKKWTDSWLIEGYGELAYHLTSFADLYVGYSAFLLSGLVLAPEQRDLSSSDRRFLRKRGQIVIDGARAGLTLSF